MFPFPVVFGAIVPAVKPKVNSLNVEICGVYLPLVTLPRHYFKRK